MPANNARVMSDELLKAFNDKYSVVYNPRTNELVVSLKKWKRSTSHDAEQPFFINSRSNPKRKVCFSSEVVSMFKVFQQDDKLKHISIFDMQNAANKLRVMYQRVTKEKVIELCTKGFSGIKRI